MQTELTLLLLVFQQLPLLVVVQAGGTVQMVAVVVAAVVAVGMVVPQIKPAVLAHLVRVMMAVVMVVVILKAQLVEAVVLAQLGFLPVDQPILAAWAALDFVQA
jgi:hypothetical protein